MTFNQSVEFPLTQTDTCTLSGQLHTQNGTGGGDINVSWRHIFSHRSWVEISAGTFIIKIEICKLKEFFKYIFSKSTIYLQKQNCNARIKIFKQILSVFVIVIIMIKKYMRYSVSPDRCNYRTTNFGIQIS